MSGYEVKFNIYANSQQEADAVSQAIIAFISENAQRGIAVTAAKCLQAVSSFGSNPFLKSRVTNYFKQ